MFNSQDRALSLSISCSRSDNQFLPLLPYLPTQLRRLVKNSQPAFFLTRHSPNFKEILGESRKKIKTTEIDRGRRE